jgi:DNA-binding MarR family transcriptional regulator
MTEKPHPQTDPSGKFAYEGLDRIMHEKARLGILTSLVSEPHGLVFGEIKELCALTDGNLSRHLQALEEAGLVEVWKGFKNRRPQTLCRMSPEGRERFLAYLGELERVVADARKATEKDSASASATDLPGEGWQPA